MNFFFRKFNFKNHLKNCTTQRYILENFGRKLLRGNILVFRIGAKWTFDWLARPYGGWVTAMGIDGWVED